MNRVNIQKTALSDEVTLFAPAGELDAYTGPQLREELAEAVADGARWLVLDMSRHFNAIRDYDPQARTVSVAPGLVLEALNTRLRKDGLFFPVEPSTASRCTIGGMIGNFIAIPWISALLGGT